MTFTTTVASASFVTPPGSKLGGRMHALLRTGKLLLQKLDCSYYKEFKFRSKTLDILWIIWFPDFLI